MHYWWDSTGCGMEEGEDVFYRLEKTKLYNGDDRTEFDDGQIAISSHRIVWNKGRKEMSLPLSIIKSAQFEEGGFLRSDKIIIYINKESKSPSQSHPGPDFVKIGGKHGVEEANAHLQQSLRSKKWDMRPMRKPPVKHEIRSGIAGIEKKLQQKSQKDNLKISKAFQDLDRLIEMAKPMVTLAQSISSKIRDRQGEITEDETVQFKSYLLSLGIDDPVTKDSAGSDKKYYQGLAKEMFLVLDQPIQEAGGMMTLTDAFVRVNRARGLELVSPEDILNACAALKETNLPLSLQTFPSGVMVLRSSNQTEEELLQKIVYLVEAFQQLTAEQLAKELKISVLLAGERLEAAASEGHVVIDKSISGVQYYPNKILKA